MRLYLGYIVSALAFIALPLLLVVSCGDDMGREDRGGTSDDGWFTIVDGVRQFRCYGDFQRMWCYEP